MACEPGSMSNLYQDHEEVAKHFANVVYNIVKHSLNFEKQDFNQHDLHLCEAYCLLWQNAETGDVDGRRCGLQLKIGTFAALFIDLCAANLIELFKNNGIPKFRLKDGISNNRKDSGLLEIAVFENMKYANSHGKLHEKILWKWLIRAVDADCVATTFDSLVARGILNEKSYGLLGKRFPTINPEPELKLEKLINNIAYSKCEPDSYMLALLVLARESDRLFLFKDPILKKHFSAAEYFTARDNIDKILTSFVNP